MGTRLYRLLSHRRPSFQTSIWHLTATLARDAGVAGSDLAAVINDGAEPNPELVRRLAPVLGFYTADMFVSSHGFLRTHAESGSSPTTF